LIHKLGKNYHYFLATPNSVARIQGDAHPFYPFLKTKPPELPSLSSDPLLIPTFVYNIQWNRMKYDSRAIFLPIYLSYTGKEISSSKKLPEQTQYLNQNFTPVQRITGSPFPAPSQVPFFIQIEDKEIIQIGGMKNHEKTELTKIKRSNYGSAKYISLRDIVNPSFTEEEVIKKIETLYFDKKSKNYLYRLVKILYSGKPEEEYKIISNLFAYELDFAKFLGQSMFSAEIIPLIHGPFLQSFISTFDERIIKFAYPKLSPPVRKVLEESVSKNKLKMIQDSSAVEPKPGEGFIETLEAEVYKKFSRNIYYEDGSIYTYRDKESDDPTILYFEDSKNINFWKNQDGLSFYGITKTKLLFRTTDWIETLRFDWFLSKREWEPFEFHRLPPNLILEIPYFPTGKCVVGGGITSERTTFEFALQWFEY
jgi:hypothetical protein